MGLDDVGDCETLRLECCRPRLSLSIPPRADWARPGRGGRALWYPSALDPRTAQVVPHAARASAVHGRERLHGPRATPLVERPDAEPSAEVVRGGLAVVAVLGLLGALRHGRQRGDGHGPGRGGPEPERGLRRAHVLHVDRALTTRARAPRWAEKIKPPSSSDGRPEGHVGSRRPRSPSVAREMSRADAPTRISGLPGRRCEPSRPPNPGGTGSAREPNARDPPEFGRSSLTRPGHGCVMHVWVSGETPEAAKHVRGEGSQPAARLGPGPRRPVRRPARARGGGRRAEAARARVGLGRRRDAGGGGGGRASGNRRGGFEITAPRGRVRFEP